MCGTVLVRRKRGFRILTAPNVGWWSVGAPEPTRCLREVYACSRCPLVGIWWNILRSLESQLQTNNPWMNLVPLNLLGHSFRIPCDCNTDQCTSMWNEKKMSPTRTKRYLKPWNMPTPILRNPYASQVNPNQKQHPVQAVGKPIHALKNVAKVGYTDVCCIVLHYNTLQGHSHCMDKCMSRCFAQNHRSKNHRFPIASESEWPTKPLLNCSPAPAQSLLCQYLDITQKSSATNPIGVRGWWVSLYNSMGY